MGGEARRARGALRGAVKRRRPGGTRGGNERRERTTLWRWFVHHILKTKTSRAPVPRARARKLLTRWNSSQLPFRRAVPQDPFPRSGASSSRPDTSSRVAPFAPFAPFAVAPDASRGVRRVGARAGLARVASRVRAARRRRRERGRPPARPPPIARLRRARRVRAAPVRRVGVIAPAAAAAAAVPPRAPALLRRRGVLLGPARARAGDVGVRAPPLLPAPVLLERETHLRRRRRRRERPRAPRHGAVRRRPMPRDRRHAPRAVQSIETRGQTADGRHGRIGAPPPTTRRRRFPPPIPLINADPAASPRLASPHPLRTVFFGGGTPSLVPPDLLRRVLSALDARFTHPP